MGRRGIKLAITNRLYLRLSQLNLIVYMYLTAAISVRKSYAIESPADLKFRRSNARLIVENMEIGVTSSSLVNSLDTLK